MITEYQKTNRQKRMSPHSGGPYWCTCCDAQLVHIGEKCRLCGTRAGKRTLKKEPL